MPLAVGGAGALLVVFAADGPVLAVAVGGASALVAWVSVFCVSEIRGSGPLGFSPLGLGSRQPARPDLDECYDPVLERVRKAGLPFRSGEDEDGKGALGGWLKALHRTSRELSEAVLTVRGAELVTAEDQARAEARAAGTPVGPVRSARRAEVRTVASALAAQEDLARSRAGLLRDWNAAAEHLEAVGPLAKRLAGRPGERPEKADVAALKQANKAARAELAKARATSERLLTRGRAHTARRLRRGALASAHCLAVLFLAAMLHMMDSAGLVSVIVLIGVVALLLAAMVGVWDLTDRLIGSAPLHMLMVLSVFGFGSVGAPLFHAAFGESVPAVITAREHIEAERGSGDRTEYEVRAVADGRSLGRIEGAEDQTVGERVEVFVDPRGWAEPVHGDVVHGNGPTAAAGSVAGLVVVLPLATVLTDPRRRG